MSLGGTTRHCVVPAKRGCLLQGFKVCFELKETHIAACVPETEATLEATSVARKLHVPQTVGFACCVFDIDNIPFHEQGFSWTVDMH